MSGFSDKLSFARGELTYHLRHTWVRTKDVIGLPRAQTDRSFYVAELARKISSGEIGRNVRITAAGKSDGAGAQGLSQVSAIAYASVLGLEYIHSPFRFVCHVEGPPVQWAQSWETNFNFGDGYRSIDTCGLPVFPLGDFLKDRSLWKKDCVVQLIHYQHWTNSNTWAYAAVAPSLRASYYRKNLRKPNEKLVVAVHVRRGDVSASRFAHTHYTPNPPIVAALRRIIAILRQRGEEPSIQIHSQGKLEDFPEFLDLDAEFHLNRPAIFSFNQLVEADILIMARSAFSFLAGILSDGLKLYDPFQEQPLPDWIVRDRVGNFDELAFNEQLAPLRTLDNKAIANSSPITAQFSRP